MLVNNAGVLPSQRTRSRDGFELTFAVNVLGPFVLTELLLGPLRRAGGARVINVSSGGMYTARLDVEDLQLERREFDGAKFYAHSKRAEVALTEAWAQQPQADGITFLSMHPGWADTPGVSSSLPRFHRVMRPLLRDAHQGADTIVWLATSPEVDGVGDFLARPPAPADSPPPRTRASPREERELLWEECARLADLGSARIAAKGNV